MRIAFVVHGYAPSIGGAQTYARGLAEALSRSGHDVHVITPAVDDPEAFYENGHARQGPSMEIMGGVTIHRLPLLSWRRRVTRRLAPVLEAERKAYAARLGDAVSAIGPDTVVALPHLFPNVSAAAELAGDASWRLVHVPMLHEHDPNWDIPAVRRIVSRADLAIALTGHERDRLREAYGARRVAIVPPGVETHRDCPGGSEGPIILFLGRPAAGKRIDLLIDATEIVRSRLPETELVVAGPGVDRLDDGPFIGVDTPGDEERARLVERARVLVNPSRIESFGLTTLDGWAHRTPIVVADTPVNRSIVEDGIDALLADDTAAGLASKMLELLTDPDRAAALGDAGHRRAGREFTWESAAESFVSALA